MKLSHDESRHYMQLERRNKLDFARQNLLDFTEVTYSKYNASWHHRAICKELHEFIFGKCDRLILDVGPRMGKSELCSRRLPAFLHGLFPDKEIISTSYSATLASEMNRDVQRIIDSPDYKLIFPKTKIYSKGIIMPAGYKETPRRNNERYDVIGHKGKYLCAGVGGGIVGQGMHYGIVDDPIKNHKEAFSVTYRNNVWSWFWNDFMSRQEDGCKVVIIMQRWHEDDLVGRLLELAKNDPDADQWKVIKYPTILERKTKGDPRKVGEVLWHAKFPLKKVIAMKKGLGTAMFNALHQQNPTPPEGTIIKRKWFKYWKELPPRFDEVVQSWDFAEGSEGGDWTVGMILAKHGPNIYILDMIRGKWDTPESMDQIKCFTEKWDEAYIKMLEKKSTGVAVIQMLQNEIPGIIEVCPTDPKPLRLMSCSPAFEAGNVFFPSPRSCPWVYDAIEELCAMAPTGTTAKNDDIVDVVTQAILRWIGDYAGEYSEEYLQDDATLSGALSQEDNW